VIFVGIDDTDTFDTQGTNQLARALVRRFGARASRGMIVRHQLFLDPRVPYTSGNGSASILLDGPSSISTDQIVHLIDELRHHLQSWFVEGSDPGLCVATSVPDSIVAFGRRCQHELIDQAEARELAAGHGIYLEGLGGTEQGVIGALAAVGLAASGNDGRVVHLPGWPWPDNLCGPHDVSALHARGVDEIRCVQSGNRVTQGIVDIGKRLRPNRHGGRVILFVSPAPTSRFAPVAWHAVRVN
jgi:hypothetical protein